MFLSTGKTSCWGMLFHVQGAISASAWNVKNNLLSRLQIFVRLLKNSILNKLINNGYKSILSVHWNCTIVYNVIYLFRINFFFQTWWTDYYCLVNLQGICPWYFQIFDLERFFFFWKYQVLRIFGYHNSWLCYYSVRIRLFIQLTKLTQ